MDNVFPFVDVPPGMLDQTAQELPLYKEYAWDFARDDFKLRDGNLVLTEGNEALKVWIYKALRTERYRYLAYSWDYGSELERLIGSAPSSVAQQSEAERYIREALMMSPYITGVRIDRIQAAGDRFEIEMTVDTVYGEVEIRV